MSKPPFLSSSMVSSPETKFMVRSLTSPKGTLTPEKTYDLRPQTDAFPSKVLRDECDYGSDTERRMIVSDSTGSSYTPNRTPRTEDLRKQLQAAEAGLLSAKLQIRELEDKITKEASAEKMKAKKAQIMSPGLKKKKNRRSRERLIVAPSARDPTPTPTGALLGPNTPRGTHTPRRAELAEYQAQLAAQAAQDYEAYDTDADYPRTPRTAAEQSAIEEAFEDEHYVTRKKKFCGPGRWFFGLLHAISTGNLCDAVAGRHALADRAAAYRPAYPSQWQEGDDIEYLAVDVVKGEKTMKWVRGQVAAVRWREVRDAPRRELRVTYYANKHHLETTYWMVPSDLRLRAPRY